MDSWLEGTVRFVILSNEFCTTVYYEEFGWDTDSVIGYGFLSDVSMQLGYPTSVLSYGRYICDVVAEGMDPDEELALLNCIWNYYFTALNFA